jgi:FKBP-type peptidyl-prolyl cis-trans isomerase FklB
MKNGLKLALAFGFGIALLLQVNAVAQDKPVSKPVLTSTMTNAPQPSPKEQKENMSYAIGMDIGKNLKRAGVELDLDVLSSALKGAMAGQPSKLTDQQAQEAIGAFRREAMAKRDEERLKTAEKNHKEGAAFLAENKKKPGIKTFDVKLPDGTAAEMQYKVITEGTGASPKSTDTVTVNYRGTLIDGKEFDNSAKRGQPAKIPLNRDNLRGRAEALQMMKAGSKWELYLPPTLAYGDQGFGPTVEAGSTLIYEVELVGTEGPPPPPPPAQPLTSDIIRVPSAEELKKGAKIEVIKAEDLEKLTNAAAQKQDKK